ncbi:MAG: MoxR family ATPase, partial [Finegoldia magna]|nr:MoxR family ATPase [Finegoldia magna]
MINLLESQNINKNLIKDVENFLKDNGVDDKFKSRIPKPRFNYYGKEVLEMAITSILEANNLLLVGPKATGKNILCDNLAYIFQRPQWNISFHVNTDS